MCAALSVVLVGGNGKFRSFLVVSALLAALAAGLVMLGVAVGVLW